MHAADPAGADPEIRLPPATQISIAVVPCNGAGCPPANRTPESAPPPSPTRIRIEQRRAAITDLS